MDDRTLMILANWTACWIGLFMCACRLGYKNNRALKPEIAAIYVVWMPTLFASSFSWIFGEPPGIAQLSLALTAVTHFSIGYEAWRNGPPTYALKADRGNQ